MTRHQRLELLFRAATAATLSGASLLGCGAGTSGTSVSNTLGDGGTTADGGIATTGDGGVITGGDGGTTTADGGPVDVGMFTDNLCAAGNYSPLASIKPKVPVGYIEIRTEYGVAGADAGTSSKPNITAKEGTVCAGASNAGACQTAYASFRCGKGWVSNNGGQVESFTCLVYTVADTVASIGTHDELASFLSPIDTPSDAALVAYMDGHTVDCSAPNVVVVGDGYSLRTLSGSACTDGGGSGRYAERTHVSAKGDVTVESKVLIEAPRLCGIGRRPEGADCVGELAGKTAGDFFAAASELEAASIVAFERLASELRAFGAPASLVRAAERARRDEVRHARVTSALATRFGGTARITEIAELSPRTLIAVALENAVEGCVHETFGALVAHYQAATCQEPEVARAMRMISVDETRHAALAWDVAAFLETQLTPAERAHVATARARAVASLREELQTGAPHDHAADTGLPQADAAVALLDRVAPALWAA